MPKSQADMEQLLEDEWSSGSKALYLTCELEAYTAGEMQQLCSLIPKAHPDVKVLNVWDNELDDAQAAAVPEALERLPHLEKLRLHENKFGGEAAAKIFIAAVPHCLHLDELYMPAHCDLNTVDWAQLGVTMSAQVLAAAVKNDYGNWDWGPMVEKQREMQAAGLVAPLPTVPDGAGVQAATQAVAHASLAAAVEELKFVAPQLIMGDAGASTRGLKEQVGLTHATMLSRLLARGWEAIEDEWLSTGDERDEANYRYIRFGKARDPNDMPPFVKEQIQRGYYHGGSITEADFDRGHDGMTLKDFVQHENSRLGKLNELHVFALRAYTSGSFPRFNKPLRDAQTPHPFKMTLYYLDEALRLLRTVEASKDSAAFLQIKYLYRGMKDMVVDAKKFEEVGGTEMACMSTTATKEVALKYAASKAPLLFRYKTRGNARGVSIQFLSMFPGEDEYLYPPLTLLLSEGPPVVEDGVTVFDVSPQMS